MNLYTYVENNPLRYTDPSGHVAESAELFIINNQINDQKLKYESNQRLLQYFDSTSSQYKIFLNNMENASKEATRLRTENSNLKGPIQASDASQSYQLYTYKTAFAGGSESQKLMRIDNKGTIYYPLPAHTKLVSEVVSVVTKTESNFVNGSQELSNNVASKLPLGSFLSSAFESIAGSPPKVGTTTTMSYIEQDDGVRFNATFKTLNGKLLDNSSWNTYGTLRYAMPDFAPVYGK